MLGVAMSLLLAALLAIFAYFRAKTKTMAQLSADIPGPKPLPILGNVLDVGISNEHFFYNINRLAKEFGPVYKGWMGPQLIILLGDPKYIEVVMSSTKTITKSYNYKFLVPWLGTGLLTSTGQKWKTHRKMITPTFHFKILEQFVEVFSRNGETLVQRLSKHVGGPYFDIFPYINVYALDVICETAMGVLINAQKETDSKYVEAVSGMGKVVMLRSFKPWEHHDGLFQLFSEARQQNWCLSILHGMTNSVIKARRKLLQEKLTSPESEQKQDDSGIKQRMAFLDLLLQASLDGETLTDEEIREEVDTFMFEGHDTTTSGIGFSLWCLAKHQDVQDKVVRELVDIFQGSNRTATYQDLQNMKYLEQVIKEALRFYPSVPLFGRTLQENVAVEGHILPEGCNVIFMPYVVHRLPEHFPNPEKFDPDRFLQENCVGRHPYSYIPFAAGPRNCIGQKFAMLEMKSTISDILRNYKITLKDPNEELDLIAELVLKPVNGINLKIESRTIT